MVLEDENGNEFDAIYIGNRTGLSGGWRGFAMEHNLEDGDVLVFELREPARFKVTFCAPLCSHLLSVNLLISLHIKLDLNALNYYILNTTRTDNSCLS